MIDKKKIEMLREFLSSVKDADGDSDMFELSSTAWKELQGVHPSGVLEIRIAPRYDGVDAISKIMAYLSLHEIKYEIVWLKSNGEKYSGEDYSIVCDFRGGVD